MKRENLPAADLTIPMTSLAAMDMVTLSPEKFTAEVYLPFKTLLAEAIAKIRDVDYDIETSAGYKVAIECRAVFRDLRISTDKERKARKAPITSIGKMLEAGYVAVEEQITPLEDLFDSDIKAEDARKEAIKQAEVVAEMARVDALEARLDAMRDAPLNISGLTCAEIREKYKELQDIVVDASFEEYEADALAIKEAALLKIAEAGNKAKASEEAAKKLIADQLALNVERERMQAVTDAANEKARKDEQEIADLRAQLAAMNAANKLAVDHEEALALNELFVAPVQPVAVDEPAPEVVETLKLSAGPLPVATTEVKSAPTPAPAVLCIIPSDTEIIMAVADHFGVSSDIAHEWILGVVA